MKQAGRRRRKFVYNNNNYFKVQTRNCLKHPINTNVSHREEEKTDVFIDEKEEEGRIGHIENNQPNYNSHPHQHHQSKNKNV
jgi:hypothetical protein